MTNRAEAPTRTLEERLSRAFELAQEIPFPAQIALVKELAHISDKLISTSAIEPAFEGLIKTATEEGNSERLGQIESLISGIPAISVEITNRQHHLLIQVAVGLEKIADETGDWHPLARAGEIYKKRWQKQEVQRIAAQLEKIADETGDWHPLAEALGFYSDIWQKQEVQRIVDKLDQLTRENDEPALLIRVGRFLIKNKETRERGVKLILEGENINEAYRLAENYSISGDLRREIKKRAEEAGETLIYNHQELLAGKGFPEDGVKAWLKEGNPQKALEISFSHDLAVQASEIIQGYNLQKEAVQIIRQMELAKAVWWADLLEMPELAFELAEKASGCSAKQIGAIEQQIWLIQVQIRSTENEKTKEALEKELLQKQYLLVGLYLNSDQTETAANYAEKIGDIDQATRIRKDGLERAVSEKKYNKAISLARALDDCEAEFSLLLKTGNYYEASSLALKQQWADKLAELVSEHLSEISPYHLSKILSLFQAKIEEIDEARETIEKIAIRLKPYFESRGQFTKAAEMCEILGLSELAAAYKELDSLLPEPEKTGHGSCYLTTACCQVMGLNDDCEILTNLRWLRDHFIRKLPDGQELIQLYYDTAPQILEKISAKELKRLFRQAIKPVSDLVGDGKYQEAFELYRKTLQNLVFKHLPSGSSV